MDKQDNKKKAILDFPDNILKRNHFERYKNNNTGNNPFLLFA